MNTLHLLSAIMPAHAAIAAAVERPSAQSIYCDLVLAKYIITERSGLEYALVFSRDLQHSEILTAHAGRAVAAGFVQFIAPDHVIASGESETLNLRSRPQDSAIIKRQLLSLP
jgi:DNA-binding transcriptional regulator LsrR (DeoR family)